MSGVCENTRALVEDLQRRLGAAEERRRAVERERDGYRGQLENPWRAVGEAGENLVKAARAQAERIRADAAGEADSMRADAAKAVEDAKAEAERIRADAERSAEEVRAKAAKAMDEAHAEAERTRKALHGELAAHDKAMTEREARADKAVKDARATVAKAYGIVKDVLDSFDEAWGPEDRERPPESSSGGLSLSFSAGFRGRRACPNRPRRSSLGRSAGGSGRAWRPTPRPRGGRPRGWRAGWSRPPGAPGRR